jgi:hypothetical protein
VQGPGEVVGEAELIRAGGADDHPQAPTSGDRDDPVGDGGHDDAFPGEGGQ